MASATISAPARRRLSRGGSCDEPPRLFADEPATATVAPPPATPATPVASATLADLVADAWDGLAASGRVPCFVCGSEFQPRWSAGAGVVGGRCDGCGTTLE